jgi:hypothetical protein
MSLWASIAIGRPDECWEWQGYVQPNGYGNYYDKADGKKHSAHREAWISVNGEIPDGLCVLHRCDNRKCCNPGHLFLGTHSDNAADKVSKGRQAKGRDTISAAKLTEDSVCAIRTDQRSQQKIADDYGITQSNVSYIKSHKKWRHI